MANISIIGAGVYGLSCGVALLKAGHNVRILEKHTIGAGASGGLVGALSPHVPEDWNVRKQYQLTALLSAAEHWTEIEILSGLPTGYGRVGRYIPLDDAYEAEKANSRISGAARLWPIGYRWDVLETAAGISPEASPFGVVYETLSARINPQLACTALAAAIVNLGGEIVQNCACHDPETTASDLTIIAAGVGSNDLLAPYLGANRIKGIKGQAALFAGKPGANTPMIFGGGTYIVPHLNGLIAVGSTSENSYDDAHSIDDKLTKVIKRAKRMVPMLRTARMLKTWTGLRPKAPKPEAMVGQLSDKVFVATGGFKTGFANTHKIAEAMVDIINGKTPDIPDDFSPTHHLTKRK